jgi:hypothetical protein
MRPNRWTRLTPNSHFVVDRAQFIVIWFDLATAFGPAATNAMGAIRMKKMSFVLAAAGLMTLAACNSKPAENNVENAADNVEAAADNLEANAADLTNEAANTAVNATENAANAVENAANAVNAAS